jgi:hypothetical protein
MTHSEESDADTVYHHDAEHVTDPRWLDTVAVAQPPLVFALYRPEQVKTRPEEGIAAWVLAVPGSVYVLSADDGGGNLVHTQSLERVEQFWAPMMAADLVGVTGLATHGQPLN